MVSTLLWAYERTKRWKKEGEKERRELEQQVQNDLERWRKETHNEYIKLIKLYNADTSIVYATLFSQLTNTPQKYIWMNPENEDIANQVSMDFRKEYYDIEKVITLSSLLDTTIKENLKKEESDYIDGLLENEEESTYILENKDEIIDILRNLIVETINLKEKNIEYKFKSSKELIESSEALQKEVLNLIIEQDPLFDVEKFKKSVNSRKEEIKVKEKKEKKIQEKRKKKALKKRAIEEDKRKKKEEEERKQRLEKERKKDSIKCIAILVIFAIFIYIDYLILF